MTVEGTGTQGNLAPRYDHVPTHRHPHMQTCTQKGHRTLTHTYTHTEAIAHAHDHEYLPHPASKQLPLLGSVQGSWGDHHLIFGIGGPVWWIGGAGGKVWHAPGGTHVSREKS